MGLSGAQADAVKRTFGMVAADITGLGTEFLVMFLNKHGYQGLFSKLKDIPAANLAGDQRTKDHATKIFTEWGQIVAVCGDDGALAKHMDKNAADHKGRNVSLAHYNNMFTDLIAFMQSKLGGAFDGDAQAGWTQLTAQMGAQLGKHL